MAKGYWVTSYRSISDPDKLAAYARLAGPAIAPFGGRYLARGTAAAAYEAGQRERIVISEFPSVERAIAAHDSSRLPGGAARAGQWRRARPTHCRRVGVAWSTDPRDVL